MKSPLPICAFEPVVGADPVAVVAPVAFVTDVVADAPPDVSAVALFEVVEPEQPATTPPIAAAATHHRRIRRSALIAGSGSRCRRSCR